MNRKSEKKNVLGRVGKKLDGDWDEKKTIHQPFSRVLCVVFLCSDYFGGAYHLAVYFLCILFN